MTERSSSTETSSPKMATTVPDDETERISAAIDISEEMVLKLMAKIARQPPQQQSRRLVVGTVVVCCDDDDEHTGQTLVWSESRLLQELSSLIRDSGGRGVLENAASELKVGVSDLEVILDRLSSSSDNNNDDDDGNDAERLQRVGLHDVMIPAIFYEKSVEQVRNDLRVNGYVAISYVASDIFDLALEQTVQILTDYQLIQDYLCPPMDKRAQSSIMVVADRHLVTPEHHVKWMAHVNEALRNVTEPTKLESLVHHLESALDLGVTIQHVKSLMGSDDDDQKLRGELRGGDSHEATFLPAIYLETQRTRIDQFFAANGYFTLDTCLAMDLPPNRMGPYLQESFPNSIVLQHCVIDVDVIASPLKGAVEEAMVADSFVNLNAFLPEPLLANEEDVTRMIQNHVLSNMESSNGQHPSSGILVQCDGDVLCFSPGMIRTIQKHHLPLLIESYAKTRAEEMDHAGMAEASMAEEESCQPPQGKKRGGSKRSTKKVDATDSIGDGTKKGKDKKRNRKGGARKEEASDLPMSDSMACSIVPLALVAQRVADAYPELADLQEDRHGPLQEYSLNNNNNDAVPWERSSEDDPGSVMIGIGPLYEFCRIALFSSHLEDACRRALRAELVRVVSTKKGCSVSGRKAGAAKTQSIDEAFQDPACFPTSFYVVQLVSKAIQTITAANANDTDINMIASLEHDFLKGCAADFTKRITQYCLFQNGVEDDIFSFHKHDNSNDIDPAHDQSNLPSFCHAVNLATCKFNPVYLSCSASENSPDGTTPQDPLPALRNVLPGSIGVALARMWVLCGGECYQHGAKVAADGSITYRPGDFAGFLRHAEESCLTICGLPFKVLDKKSEKQTLFARRHELSQALDRTMEPGLVLDLTIMLLFQQVKHLTVNGLDLRDTILKLLVKEKKIPDAVATEIEKLANCINNGGQELGDLLVYRVKEFGLCRDISKVESTSALEK